MLKRFQWVAAATRTPRLTSGEARPRKLMMVMPPVMMVSVMMVPPVVTVSTMQMATMPIAVSIMVVMLYGLNQTLLSRSIRVRRKQRRSLGREGGCRQDECTTEQRGNDRTTHGFLLCAFKPPGFGSNPAEFCTSAVNDG